MLYIQNFKLDNLEYEAIYSSYSDYGDFGKYYAYIVFNTIEEYRYSFNENGDLQIIPSAVSSENIEKFLTGAIGNLGEFTDEEYYCRNLEIGNFRGEGGFNLVVEDGNIVCGVPDGRGNDFATFIKIPYSYNEADNTLTLTIDGSQHVLEFKKPVIRYYGDYYDINYWKLITE